MAQTNISSSDNAATPDPYASRLTYYVITWKGYNCGRKLYFHSDDKHSGSPTLDGAEHFPTVSAAIRALRNNAFGSTYTGDLGFNVVRVVETTVPGEQTRQIVTDTRPYGLMDDQFVILTNRSYYLSVEGRGARYSRALEFARLFKTERDAVQYVLNGDMSHGLGIDSLVIQRVRVVEGKPVVNITETVLS